MVTNRVASHSAFGVEVRARSVGRGASRGPPALNPATRAGRCRACSASRRSSSGSGDRKACRLRT